MLIRRLSRSPAAAPKSSESKEPARLGAGTVLVFLTSAAATLVGGVGLEVSSDHIAGSLGIGGVLFGATFLSAATSLPEVSTGIAALRRGERELAVSDVVGGNAFLPVLLVVTGIIAGTSMFALIDPVSRLVTVLGAVMTLAYAAMLARRPSRRVLGFGVDSLLLMALFAVGMVVLVAVT